jgi:Cu(I)/Ag(I) efflux system protein CusF
MNRLVPVLAVLLIAGCNAAPEAAPPAASTPALADAPAEPAPAAAPTPAAEVKRGSATGVVQSVDVEAKTITIAHGPVEALGWPGMTMAFQAPNVDFATIKAGDNVSFEFESAGADGTIVSITKQ